MNPIENSIFHLRNWLELTRYFNPTSGGLKSIMGGESFGMIFFDFPKFHNKIDFS